MLSAPPEVALSFPDTLQRLIGYDLGGTYLGFIEQGNPHRLLEEGDAGDYARTEPDLDARRARIKPIPFGSITPRD